MMESVWWPAGHGRKAWLAAIALGAATVGLLATEASASGDAVVIGDSLGVGVSMASGLTRLARNSVAIRGGSILGQLHQAPAGATVFMSLGTNDAVGRIDGLDGDIARIIAASTSAGVKLVWIGPPCVSKGWDTNAVKLDAILRARTAGTAVTYVSMRDPGMCDPGVRARDGVHFTMGGYGLMWAKARAASGFTGGAERTQFASVSRRSHKRRYARRRTAPKVVAEGGAEQGAPAKVRRAAPTRTGSIDRPGRGGGAGQAADAGH